MAITLKLPAEIIAKHGEELQAWDWKTNPSFSLAEAIPHGGFMQADRLTLSSLAGMPIICAATLGAANRLRQYAESLPQQGRPTPEAVARVLERRNPQEV